MKNLSLITQIGMIAIAIAIVFMYIEPKISTIRDTQDITISYEKETQNVSQVNQNLRSKIAVIESISPQDTDSLVKYIPDSIDEISVLKDLSTVLESQGLNGFDIKYESNNSLTQQNDDVVSELSSLTEHYFLVTFESSYSQLKEVLALLETNNYLLQVSKISITEVENDVIKVDMNLTAFTRLLVIPELN
jgi:hypothetical protein